MRLFPIFNPEQGPATTCSGCLASQQDESIEVPGSGGVDGARPRGDDPDQRRAAEGVGYNLSPEIEKPSPG